MKRHMRKDSNHTLCGIEELILRQGQNSLPLKNVFMEKCPEYVTCKKCLKIIKKEQTNEKRND